MEEGREAALGVACRGDGGRTQVGMASLSGRIAGLEAQVKATAADSQAASTARLQAQIQASRAGRSGDRPCAPSQPMGQQTHPSYLGIPSQGSRPLATKRFSAMLYFPCSVAPDHQTTRGRPSRTHPQRS